jgi:hypothetical protein
MAHWAEIDENNVVLRVVVGNNDKPDEGYQWLVDNLGGTWLKTSYNSRHGKRVNPETGEVIVGGVPYRGNFAQPGGTYNEEHDIFVDLCPFSAWVLDVETCRYLPPWPKPTDGKHYDWDEEVSDWLEIPITPVIGTPEQLALEDERIAKLFNN